MNISKRRILTNAFFKSRLSYCLLVWMCHNRANNIRLNRLQERCLGMIYSDKRSSFETLLEKGSPISIHNQIFISSDSCNRNYKIKNDLSSFIVTKLFEQRNEQYYDLRNNPQLTRLPTRTVCHGSESISFLGLKFKTFYQKVNNAISIGAFNIQLKKMEAWKLAVPALQGLCSNGRFCLRKFR